MPKPTAKGRDVLRRIEQRRRNITDVIVTAVILGLTLNNVSDYIMSLEDYSEVTLLQSPVLALGSIIVTVLLLIYLVSRDMEDMARIDMERTIHLFWNIDTGQPMLTNDAFWAQDRFYYAFNKWVPDFVKESTVNALRENLIPKKTFSHLTPEQRGVLVPYFNLALFLALLKSSSVRSDYGISEVEKISMSQILDVPVLQYDPLTSARLELPGHVRCGRKSIGDERVIEFQWHKGYSGRLKITCVPERPGIVYRFLHDDDFSWWEVGGLEEVLDTKVASRTAYAAFSVTFEGNFSRWRLYLNIGHANELRAWFADFLSNIGDTLNG